VLKSYSYCIRIVAYSKHRSQRVCIKPINGSVYIRSSLLD